MTHLKSLFSVAAICALAAGISVFAEENNQGAPVGAAKNVSKAEQITDAQQAGQSAPSATQDMQDQAAKKDAAGATASTNASPADLAVLKRLHQINQAEIKIGNLAEDKGTQDRIKDYGKELVKDHTSAEARIAKLADKLKLDDSQWMVELTPKQKDDYAKLESLDGAKFDQRFSSKMEQGHQEAISFVQKSLKNAKSPELKELLTELMPKLKHHREMARDLKAKGNYSA
jgi:putative membrane protein